MQELGLLEMLTGRDEDISFACNNSSSSSFPTACPISVHRKSEIIIVVDGYRK